VLGVLARTAARRVRAGERPPGGVALPLWPRVLLALSLPRSHLALASSAPPSSSGDWAACRGDEDLERLLCGLGCFVPGLLWAQSFNWYGAVT